MSGIRRQILAELAGKGVTGEAAQKQLTAEGFRKESGRSVFSEGISTKNGDSEVYIGKSATPQHPK